MNYDIIACPICSDGEIQVIVHGGVWTEHRSVTATLGRTTTRRKSSTSYTVQTDCPNCGAKADEMERML